MRKVRQVGAMLAVLVAFGCKTYEVTFTKLTLGHPIGAMNPAQFISLVEPRPSSHPEPSYHEWCHFEYVDGKEVRIDDKVVTFDADDCGTILVPMSSLWERNGALKVNHASDIAFRCEDLAKYADDGKEHWLGMLITEGGSTPEQGAGPHCQLYYKVHKR